MSCTSYRSLLVRCLTMLVLITTDRATILILIRDFPVPFHVTLVQFYCGIKGAWKPLENQGESKEQLECQDKTLSSCTCSEEDGTLGKTQFLDIKPGLLSILVFASIVLLRCHMYLSSAHRIYVSVWALNSNHQVLKVTLVPPLEGLNSQRSQLKLALEYLRHYSQYEAQIYNSLSFCLSVFISFPITARADIGGKDFRTSLCC